MSNLMQLNNSLFAELERLERVDTSDNEAMAAEIERADAIGKIAKSIIQNANLIVRMTAHGTDTAENVKPPKGLING